ncbi:MAG: DUF3488 domain-containing protein [Phycisphaerales bacterium]|nr:DUF3488 domain-containing protein [Phycisphaerales bacterium]MCB9856941.1 DUF3488 domain-containing protein [Phycisphaerales bacterium]MCB9861932.1 DUF3488 domain-containing protein [Phycisphaerales bacterium]
MRPLSPLHIVLLLLTLANMLPAMEVEGTWWLYGIAIGCAALSCLWLSRSDGRPLPQWVIHLSVFASVAFLCWEMFGQHDEPTVHIVDLSHFIALLACIKFFECVTYRDAGLIAIISFLLMSISALISASPMFGLVIALDLTIGVGWLMSFHAERDQYQIETRMLKLSGSEPVVVSSSTPSRKGPAYSRAVGASAIYLLITALVIFVFLPRGLYGGIFGRMHGLVPVSVTGLSDVVELNDSAVFEDPTPVFKVRFSKGGIPISGEDYSAYLRSRTFDRYYQGRWSGTPMLVPRAIAQFDPDTPAPLIDMPAAPALNTLLKQEFWLDSIGSGVLFAVYPPVLIDAKYVKGLRQDRNDFTMEAAGIREAAQYTVYSLQSDAGPVAARLRRESAPRREFNSEIPLRVRELASELALRFGDPSDAAQHEAIARGFERYLNSTDFEYTLRRGPLRKGVEPVVDFLFDNRRGHCEFFATAMVLMCQSVGIRARLVSGYHGGEFNDAGGFFRVRQKDAHAWVEVYTQGRGWLTFDPTPAGGESARRRDESLWAQARRSMDFLQFKWSTWVVSFDQESRDDLAAGVKKWLAKFSEDFDERRTFGELIKTFIYGPDVFVWWQRVLYWLLLLLFVVLVVLLFRVLWILSLYVRELVADRSETQERIARRPEARFYDRLLLLLAAKGHVKPPHVTPREFALKLSAAHEDLRALSDFTEWFYEVQYGQRDLSESRWQRLRQFITRLREDAAFGSRT